MNDKIISLIIFDTETNGLTINDSVLSISAIKVFYDKENNRFLKDFEAYDRYYYIKLGEAENEGALNVNGLYSHEISKRRGEENYPRYFYEDIGSFIEFCKGSHHFIGHNINFDLKYVKSHMDINHTFDTMSTNKNVMKLSGNYGYKNPKLSEAAKYYNIDVDQYSFHSSLDDVKVTAKIFRKMCKDKNIDALKFINQK